MKTSKHTPGPWTFTEGDKERRGSSRVLHNGQDDMPIADVVCEWSNAKQRAEDIANARLIAASPDLLAALQMVCDSGCSLSDAITDKMTAALTKATGEAK